MQGITIKITIKIYIYIYKIIKYGNVSDCMISCILTQSCMGGKFTKRERESWNYR